MKLNTGIAAMGLAALLEMGCERGDTTHTPPPPIIERVYIEKPAECLRVRDIRREIEDGYSEVHLLCDDPSGRMVLYTRPTYHPILDYPLRWKRIEVR